MSIAKKEELNLNEAIITIRVALHKKNLKKSGKNKFAGFEYYELSDILPTLNELMLENRMNDQFIIGKEYAELTLIKGAEKQRYTLPFVMFDTPKNKNGGDSMQPIQYLGAQNTYYKRYLYLNAFGITDGEVIDGMDNQQQYQPPKQQPLKTVTQEQVMQIEALIVETSTDRQSFIDFLKSKGFQIENIQDIQMMSFKSVYDILMQKKKGLENDK
jgi:hypothetical protein